jgi:steroid delta-isomerase-like uncharacterized protein
MSRVTGTDRVSRRVALRTSSAAAAAFALAGARATLAQDATPASADLPAAVRDWVAAWNSSDPAANIAALYSPDGVYEDDPTGTSNTTTGTDLASFIGSFAREVSDLSVDLRSGFGTADHAAVEWDRSFSYTGQLPGLPLGSGQHVVSHGVTIFALQDGKIRRSTDYYDRTPLLVAAGQLPAALGTPEA